jgi:hypothetical protein
MSTSKWARTPSGRTIRRKKKGRSGQPFVQLHTFMLKTRAWRSLSCTARAAYVHLASRYNGSNNGELGLGCRTLGDELGCSRATASRALLELEDAGFIDTMKIGSFARRNRKASEYRLTMFACNVTNTSATKRFLDWVPAASIVSPLRQHGSTHETTDPS